MFKDNIKRSKKMNLKSGLFVIFLLLIIPISFGLSSYNETGTIDGQFVSGTGIFNENLVTSTITSRNFDTLTNIPIVADLDNDGINEIIIVDSPEIRLLDTNLVTVNAITLESGTYSNPIINDIDSDGFPEIILANEVDGNISILQFNGSLFERENTLPNGLPTITGTIETVLHCNDGQSGTEAIACLGYTIVSPTGAPDRNITMFSFNSTGVQDIITTDSVGSNNHICAPLIANIVESDYDNDGRKEFIFDFTIFSVVGNDALKIIYVDVLANLSILTEQTISFTSTILPFPFSYNPVVSGASSCDDSAANPNIARFFTNVLVENIDGIISNGKETIVGINIDTNDFKMIAFRSTGGLLDAFPIFFQADGEILSNVMLSNVFGDTGNVDFCVLGHDDDNQELDLLCASKTTGNIVETVEFKFNTDNRFNITAGFEVENMISHAGQHSNQQINIENEGNTDTTEIITAYGVFRLNDDTFNGSFFVKNLDLIFDNPVGDSACISVDAQQVGSEDIICLTPTQIFYIDDALENQPAKITEVTFNPCVIDSVIKVNETLQILVTVTDQNPSPLSQDLVSSIITVYKDDGNEVSSTIGNVTSGQIQPHSFILNKTGTGFNIEIQGFDIENPDTIDIETQSFTVATNGIKFGDSTCTISFVIEEEIAIEDILNVSATATANEGLTNFIEGASNTFRISPLIVILFLMLGWTIAVLTTGGIAGMTVTMNKVLFMLIGNIFIFIMGAIVGAIPFGVLLVVIILGIFSIVLWARRVFTTNEM